jgi:hypothetical protein
MSWKSFWSSVASIFTKVNPHKLAGVFAGSVRSFDSFISVEYAGMPAPSWVTDVDKSSQALVAAMDNWNTGSAPQEVIEAVQTVTQVIAAVPEVPDNVRLLLAAISAAANEITAFVG